MNLTPDLVRRVMAPKVDALWHLHELTRGRPLDFFLLTSSVVSSLGNSGQAAYAAANSLLDFFAHYRRANGLPATVINWGPISDVGVLTENLAVAARIARMGMTSTTPHQAWQVIRACVCRGRLHVGFLRINLRTWMEMLHLRRLPCKLAPLLSETWEEVGTQDRGRGLKATLAGMPREQHGQVVDQFVVGLIGEVLGMSAEAIDLNEPLDLLGLDSLMAVDLHNRLERELGVSLAASTLSDKLTTATLAGNVLRALQ
jgi:acyl carrier protein